MIEFEINTNKKQIDFEVTQGIPKYVPANFQSKTVVPTTEQQIVRADIGYDGLEQVTVEKINLSNKTITENGTYNAKNENIDGYSSVEVNVQPTLQEKSVTITENGTTEVLADHGYDGLAKVSVEANVKDNSLLNAIKGLNSYNTSNYPFELTADMFDENSTEIYDYKFYGNANITKVEVPSNINKIGRYGFSGCSNLEIVNINGAIENNNRSNNYAFRNCYKIKEINAPLLKRVGESMFALSTSGTGYSHPLKEVNLPSVIELCYRAFSYRQGIEKIRIPNCNTINNNVLDKCYTLKLVDFRGRTSNTIPTLSSASTFLGSYKIVVPDELYDEWIVATNWASIASNIVKASEYTEA